MTDKSLFGIDKVKFSNSQGLLNWPQYKQTHFAEMVTEWIWLSLQDFLGPLLYDKRELPTGKYFQWLHKP